MKLLTKKLNFNVICDMVQSSVTSGVNDKLSVDIPFKIVRNTKTKDIITKREKINYKIVYNKRVIIDNFDTLPYGF